MAYFEIYLGAYPYPAIASENLLSELLDGTRLDKPEHCADKLCRHFFVIKQTIVILAVKV